MKEIQIIKFRAFDGSLFSKKEDCKKYEILAKKINKIMKTLNPIPNDCDFTNGDGYIQQDKTIIATAKMNILELGQKLYKDNKISWGWLGRYADDSNDRTLYHAWGRLSNIDSKHREWGQQYFAINTSKGVQKPYKKEL